MKPSGLFDKEAIEVRRRALDSFSAWEKSQSVPPPPADAIARLDELLRLMPPQPLSPRRPGHYAGVAALRAALSHLGRVP